MPPVADPTAEPFWHCRWSSSGFACS